MILLVVALLSLVWLTSTEPTFMLDYTMDPDCYPPGETPIINWVVYDNYAPFSSDMKSPIVYFTVDLPWSSNLTIYDNCK